MTLSSNEISAVDKTQATPVGFGIRLVAVLSLLLLAALVQIAAESYYDPEHRLDAAQQFPAP